MTRRGQTYLVLHGAIFLFAAMVIGIPEFRIALSKAWDDIYRQFWRQSHAVLVITGVWLIAGGAVLPLLDLSARGVNVVVWSLIISGYTFLASIAIQGSRLHFGLPPYQGPWFYPYAAVLAFSSLLALIADVMIIWGAFKALRQSKLRTVH
jgi:hypothetical protein